MKKLVFILLLFISVFSFSKENFTENEKNSALKQFIEFQKALKNKDINTLKNYIDNPVNLFTYIGENYEGPVSHDEIDENKAMFMNNMKEITFLKVDLNSNTVKSYKKGEIEVTAGFEPGKKTFEVVFYYNDPKYQEYNRYVFNFKNNELKLHAMYAGPLVK